LADGLHCIDSPMRGHEVQTIAEPANKSLQRIEPCGLDR
jgi:hypothetical protein